MPINEGCVSPVIDGPATAWQAHAAEAVAWPKTREIQSFGLCMGQNNVFQPIFAPQLFREPHQRAVDQEKAHGWGYFEASLNVNKADASTAGPVRAVRPPRIEENWLEQLKIENSAGHKPKCSRWIVEIVDLTLHPYSAVSV